MELCRFDGALLCAPRLVDVRVLWARTDRVATVPDTWAELLDGEVVFGFPGRESGLFGTFFELVVGAGGALFDATGRPTMATPEAVWAVEALCRLAARAPSDLPDWHYDGVDAALLSGRVDAAAAWPGGWGAIRASAHADVLAPALYPAGSARRVSYSGCHAWAIPTTCGDLDGAVALVTELLGRDAQARDAAGGNMCAHLGALAAVDPENDTDRRPPRDHPRHDRHRDDHLPPAHAVPRDRGRGLVGDPGRHHRSVQPARGDRRDPGRRRRRSWALPDR